MLKRIWSAISAIYKRQLVAVWSVILIPLIIWVLIPPFPLSNAIALGAFMFVLFPLGDELRDRGSKYGEVLVERLANRLRKSRDDA